MRMIKFRGKRKGSTEWLVGDLDHIEPVVRNWWNGTYVKPENENTANYNPSCPSCNIQKNSLSLEDFRENIRLFVQSLNKYSTQYKFAKKYGLVYETGVEVKFYFETLTGPEGLQKNGHH